MPGSITLDRGLRGQAHFVAIYGHLDTSAFVPLLIDEPTSKACRRFWDDASVIVSSRLLHVETATTLVQARRMGYFSQRKQLDAHRRLDRM